MSLPTKNANDNISFINNTDIIEIDMMIIIMLIIIN